MRQLVARDERELSVERAGDRLAWLVLSYGLLLVVAYRRLVAGEASWDLLALVVLGGAVGAGYRLWHRALSRRELAVLGATAAIAAVVAAALALGLLS